MYKTLSILAAATVLATGCMTLSGSYEVIAYDQQGNRLLPQSQMKAHGTGIYTVRNAVCESLRGEKAIVRMYDTDTGKEVRSESPYHCKE
ncbi:hypothetical protein VQ643_06820 [Pseudomonas sp. F1_0610]|uniref:hypothetical protein n=1 Tax=Pseudomonas sp. F1_0610 TaxID=3114284 RepID=UPI0039C2D607